MVEAEEVSQEVAVVPLEGAGPVIPLRRLGDTDVFEGYTSECFEVFPYELAIEWASGEQWGPGSDPKSCLLDACFAYRE